MKRKIVYIAHPIRRDVTNNMRFIREKVKFLFDHQPDVVPFVPYYVYVDSLAETDHDKGMQANFDILRSGAVNELWLMGDHISKGMQLEINVANEMKIPVIYKLDNPINDNGVSRGNSHLDRMCMKSTLGGPMNSGVGYSQEEKIAQLTIENANLKFSNTGWEQRVKEVEKNNAYLLKEAEQKKQALHDWQDKFHLAQEQGAMHAKHSKQLWEKICSIQNELSKALVDLRC